MKVKKLLLAPVIMASLALFSAGCRHKPTDAEIKTKVETAVSNPAVKVAVKECDVTLSGSVGDDASKNAAESAAKSVEGVKEVTNAIAVAEPLPVQAPVEVASDATISAALVNIVSNYKNVKATVNDGVVTLTGDIRRSELPKLMQSVMALKPKNVDNKLTIK